MVESVSKLLPIGADTTMGADETFRALCPQNHQGEGPGASQPNVGRNSPSGHLSRSIEMPEHREID